MMFTEIAIETLAQVTGGGGRIATAGNINNEPPEIAMMMAEQVIEAAAEAKAKKQQRFQMVAEMMMEMRKGQSSEASERKPTGPKATKTA